MKPGAAGARNAKGTQEIGATTMLLLGALLALQVTSTDTSRGPVATLVARARDARYQQDSSLASYEVIVRQRMSGGIGLARGFASAGVTAAAALVGRERLAVRFESVARVGWHRELGAWAEVIGARSVAPMLGVLEPDPDAREEDGALVLPYVPGRDRLWPMDELRDALPQADDWIEHPLAPGADSLYDITLGDSVAFRLPNRTVLILRELRVRPRRPDSRLIVGSLWVDAGSGSLVRAAYRPSVAMDLWPFMYREIGRNDRDKVARFGPFTGIVREVLVEHVLHDGRFWLPRARTASAEGTAKGGRVTVSIEQTFTYEHVAALPPERVRDVAVDDVRDVDPRTGRVRRPKWRGVEERTRRCRERGDSSARWSADSLLRDEDLSVMYAEGVRFRVLLPCNSTDLVHSVELPPSIYSDGEELFTDTDFNALRRDVEQALALGSQAQWAPRPWTITYGLEEDLLRYNRVEGLSAGARARRELGDGYLVQATARLGLADLEPNVELLASRSNVRATIGASAYRRLVAANDWGSPLGLGASINALLFGRDEGFFYRAVGAELGGGVRASNGNGFTWRLFGERHDSAAVATHASLARLVNDRRFPANIGARAETYWGGAAGFVANRGIDPRGLRLSSSTRVEGAVGEHPSNAYGRLMSELTLARGLGDAFVGSLTAGAGTSLGVLPAQRLWYLGGAHTVRGFRAGESAGDAYWLARAELGFGHPLARPTIFADAGWAGSRLDWSRPDSPLAGVGAGIAILDGLVRVDVSRGLARDRLLRLDLYFDVR